MPMGSGWELVFSGRVLQVLNHTPWALDTVLVLLGGVLVVELVEMLGVKPGQNVGSWVRSQKWFVRWPLYYALLIGLMAFGMFGQSTFIYQQY